MLAETAAAIARAIATEASKAAVGEARKRLGDRLDKREVAGAVIYAVKKLDAVRPGAREELFDDAFLRKSGPPVLVRYLTPGARPTPETLADEWLKQFRTDLVVAPPEILATATDFLVSFEEGLRRSERLRKLLDSWAADQAADAVTTIERYLKQQRSRASIDPRPLYRELRLDRFVGREWVRREIAEFLATRPSGCVVVQGGPGVGKTTLLAWLALQRGYPQHFVRLADGRDDASAALSNLAAQLAGAWNLEVPLSLFAPDVRPDEFASLLEDCARERDRRSLRERIVLVIDGLDEAARPRDTHNVLGLPRSLPEGVYLIVSQQPADVPLNISPRGKIDLTVADSRHLEDLDAYLREAVLRPGVAIALRESGLTESHLIDALRSRGGGVWLYAHHVLEEIDSGERKLADLESLPFGLWHYYDQRWRSRGVGDEPVAIRVLATLAVGGEPVAPATLAVFSGVVPDRVADVLAAWTPFVTLERDRGVYRMHHDSFRSFLRGEPMLGDPLAGETMFRERLAAAATAAHKRIADHFLTAWGGLAAGLPDLPIGRVAGPEVSYGRRHLISHLTAVRPDAARDVLALEHERANSWFALEEGADDVPGYLDDVATVWRAAEATSDRDLRAGRTASRIALEYGCALLTASVGALARRVPSSLRIALLRSGRWSPARALADARALPAGQRARALIGIEPYVGEELREATQQEALDAAFAIADLRDRVFMLAELVGIDGVGEPERRRVLDAALEIGNSELKALLLEALASDLTPAMWQQAWDAACSIADPRARVDAAIKLVERRGVRPTSGDLDAVLAIADGEQVADVLRRLSYELPHTLTERALELARGVGDPAARSFVLAVLGGRLSEAQRGPVYAEALQAAIDVPDERSRADALRLVARGELSEALVARGLDAARAIDDEESRGHALEAFAECLPEKARLAVFAEVLEAVTSAPDGFRRGIGLMLLAERIPAALVPDLARAASTVADERFRAPVLAKALPRLPSSRREEVRALAATISDAGSRAGIVADIAAHLSGSERDAAVAEALDIARAIDRFPERALALIKAATVAGGATQLVTLEEVLDAPMDGSATHIVEIFDMLAAALPDQLTEQPVERAAAFGSSNVRARSLAALAGRLCPELASRALEVAHAADDQDRDWLLARLAERLPPESVDAAFTAATSIDDEEQRAQALVGVAGRLPADRVGDVLDAARRIGDPKARTTVASGLAPGLPTPCLPRP